MILGLDASTAIVGVTLLKMNGEFLKTFFIDLRKTKDFVEKCTKFSNEIQDEILEFGSHISEVKKIFIEDKLSGFSGGRTSQQTMMKLGAFNGAVTFEMFRLVGIHPIHIHPSTIKASMKKEGLIIPKGSDKKKLTLDWVRNEVKDFPYKETRNGNPQTYCYDMADSYCIAYTGYRKFICGKKKS